MNLPPLLVEIFDPAGRYMRKHGGAYPAPQRQKALFARSRRRPLVEGGAVFGPNVPGGSRQATAEELASRRERVQQDRARYENALEAARRRWSKQALVCARELLGSGTTVLSVDDGQVRGHLVRFWHGDCVLEFTASGRNIDSLGRSMARLSRGQDRNAEPIAQYLIHQVANLQDRPC